MTQEEKNDIRATMADPAIGVTVTIKLAGVTVRTINAFYEPGGEVITPGEVEVFVRRPSLLPLDDDVADLTKVHTLGVHGTDYRQFGEPQPDGDGLTRIFLVK